MKKKKYLLPGMFGMIFALAVMFPCLASTYAEEPDVIPQGVYAGEIPIGGMTREKAAQAVEESVEALRDKKITLYAGEKTLETTAGELGLSWENPEIVVDASKIGTSGNLIIRYKELKELEKEDKVYGITYGINKKKALELIKSKGAALNVEPVDAVLERKDGAFSITPESLGITVKAEESARRLETFFREEWDGNDAKVELAADIAKPKATQEEFAKVKDLLGTFHTGYGSSNAGRRKNVENGTAKIDGQILYPGEEFSAYAVVSPFDEENGYALGGAYENGKVVQSYGGGICQVSTTLYNAAIRAELEITERYPHSMTVSYVQPSEDAAIAGTYKDLKFKNNTGAPIYIEGYTAADLVYFNIYGQETRPENRQVSYVSELITSGDSKVRYQAAGSRPIGYISSSTAASESRARLWKIITVDGVEQSREEFNTSSYRSSVKIVMVGTASGNPEAVAAINAAIASQSQGAINAAAAKWNDSALQAAAQAAEQAAQQPLEQPMEGEPQQPQEPGPQQPPEEEPQEPQEGGDREPPEETPQDPVEETPGKQE